MLDDKMEVKRKMRGHGETVCFGCGRAKKTTSLPSKINLPDTKHAFFFHQ